MSVWERARQVFDTGSGSTQFFTLTTSSSTGEAQLSSSDVVSSAITWIGKGVIQTEIRMDKDSLVDVPRIINRPSSYYNGKSMLMAVTASLCINGTAFIRLLKTNNRIIGMLWLPVVMDVVEDGELKAYKYYTVKGGEVFIEPEDMLVFRHGVHPDCPWRGLSPLRNLLNEASTDSEAGSFTYDTLKNMPLAGMLVGPKEGYFQAKSKDDHNKLEKSFQEHFGGANRGKASLVTHAFEIGYVQPDMAKIDLARLRDVPEERICAALGVQPAVVSFGAGLQTTKVGATMVEMTRQSWKWGTLPIISIIEDTFNEQLVEKYDPGNKLNLSVAKIDDLRMPIKDILELLSAKVIDVPKAAELAGVA